MTSRDDMAGLVAELRGKSRAHRIFARDAVLVGDFPGGERQTGVALGLAQAADAIESTSRSMEAGEVAKLLEEAAALSHDTLAGRATMRVMIIRLIEAVRALSPVPGEGVTDADLIGGLVDLEKWLLDRATDTAKFSTIMQQRRTEEYRARGDLYANYQGMTPAETQEWGYASIVCKARAALTAALSPPVKGKE